MAGRKLYICNPDGVVLTMMSCGDDSVFLKSSVGEIQVSAITPSTPAQRVIAGSDANGDVTVKARYGGAHGNNLNYEQVTGPVGAGNENLPLRVDVSGDDVSVKFATDGAGASITPTANDLATLINNDDALPVEIELGGTGASAVSAAAMDDLAGGLDDGDWLKFGGAKPHCCRVNRAEAY